MVSGVEGDSIINTTLLYYPGFAAWGAFLASFAVSMCACFLKITSADP